MADGSFIEVQLEARSKDIDVVDAALFSVMHHELRVNYWFVFYSEWLHTMWIMTSQQFLNESIQNKSGATLVSEASGLMACGATN